MTPQESIIVLNMIETHGSLPTQAKNASIEALKKQVPTEKAGTYRKIEYIMDNDVYAPDEGITMVDIRAGLETVLSEMEEENAN